MTGIAAKGTLRLNWRPCAMWARSYTCIRRWFGPGRLRIEVTDDSELVDSTVIVGGVNAPATGPSLNPALRAFT